MQTEQNQFGRWSHVLLIAVLLCSVVVSFHLFTKDNQRRILAQNQDYLTDIAAQAAGRLEDMLHTRKINLKLLSITVSETIKEPWVGQGLLQLLQETSVFDYVEFIDSTGLNHNAEGKTSDSTDRKSYLEGMKGDTGMDVIFHSRITKETLVVFFTPVYYRGRIIGVLNGMFREETMRQAIATKLFNVEAQSCLCEADGTVISSSGIDVPPVNLFDLLEEREPISNAPLEDIRKAFSTHQSLRYTSQTSSDNPGNVCVVPVETLDWMLVQAFPSAATERMEKYANASGAKLELRLLGLSLVYVAYLILTNRRQRRRLTHEKVRLSGIIEGLLPLFARLGIVDFEKGTYQYLQGVPPGLTDKGTLIELADYLNGHYYRDINNAAPTWQGIREELTKEVPYLQYAYRIRWEEDRWENISLLNLERKETELVSAIFAVQDVTVLKQREATIQQATQDAFLAAADLERAKSDFLSRMSHDMRTPMNAVLGMVPIALAHLDNPGRVRECLEKIDVSGRRLLDLINEILDMSKIENGGMALASDPFFLPDALNHLLDETRSAAAAKGLTLSADPFQFEHTAVLGDSERLQQALRNLLSNAVKYTPAGGTISFCARELPFRQPGNGYFEFVLEDTGIGMEPALLPHVFEPFVCAEPDQNSQSAGLGLPIAKTIVKLMNGDISVESQLGQGSRFTVRLFLKLQQQANDLSGKENTSDLPSRTEAELEADLTGIRVLLTEDNALNMEVARELLEMAGIQVEVAENGAEAVAMVQEHPPSYYDFIFMDIQMPVMDGYEAARTIRSLGREDLQRIPIVALSANAFQDDVRCTKEAGMNDHVMKPVELDKLLHVLHRWLR